MKHAMDTPTLAYGNGLIRVGNSQRKQHGEARILKPEAWSNSNGSGDGAYSQLAKKVEDLRVEVMEIKTRLEYVATKDDLHKAVAEVREACNTKWVNYLSLFIISVTVVMIAIALYLTG